MPYRSTRYRSAMVNRTAPTRSRRVTAQPLPVARSMGEVSSFARSCVRPIPGPAPSSERVDFQRSPCSRNASTSARHARQFALQYCRHYALDAHKSFPGKHCAVRCGSTKNWVRSRERPQRGSSPHCGRPGQLQIAWYSNLAGVPTVEHPVPKMDSG